MKKLLFGIVLLITLSCSNTPTDPTVAGNGVVNFNFGGLDGKIATSLYRVEQGGEPELHLLSELCIDKEIDYFPDDVDMEHDSVHFMLESSFVLKDTFTVEIYLFDLYWKPIGDLRDSIIVCEPEQYFGVDITELKQ